ncbi:MAG: diguanylate cyclase, partial [Nitrospirota bacterium]|nr:diguanylate cyclase [Nitrospirota bacterium]
GIEAAEKVYETNPDIVILDIMMPRMNGYQTCRLLKNDPSTKHLPVIILTSKDQASDKFWGMVTGADAYITKDFQPQQLLESVDRIFSEKRTEAPALPSGQKPRSTLDVISKVNDLLDKKLYEATIINEIGNVAHNLSNFEETVKAVMILLSKLVDHTAAAVALSMDDKTELLIYLNHAVDESFVKEFRTKVLAELGSHGADMKHREVVETILHKEPDTESTNEKEARSVKSLLTTPIRISDEVRGLFAIGSLASSWFNEEDHEILDIISNQAFVVIENARLYREISRLSVTDGLTGIFNRRYLMEALEKEFIRAKRHNEPISQIMVDIDHFKKVNDTYGHQMGDLVLKETARLLKDALRKSDIIGRYGGEEFCIILPETPLKGAEQVAEHLRTAIETHLFEYGDVSLHATASLGVSSFPENGVSTVDELSRLADEALYRAKEGGRNRVCSS